MEEAERDTARGKQFAEGPRWKRQAAPLCPREGIGQTHLEILSGGKPLGFEGSFCC